MKLSYSGAKKYAECGEAYRLHYEEKLRSVVQKSALLFGTAVDKAIDALLQGNKEPEKVFIEFWSNQLINGVPRDLKKFSELVYSDSEFDEDIVLPDDKQYINLERFYQLKEKKSIVSWEGLSPEEKSEYNEANWFSLKAKGLLMVTAFKEKALPNIEHVYGTQLPIELKNNEGDVIPGFCDFVVKWKGVAEPIVFDLKTSAIDYQEDSVIKSNQLATYVHSLSEKFEGTRTAGYIVLKKRVMKNRKKKCSSCKYNGTGSKAKTCDNQINDKRCGAPWIETITPEIDVQIIIDKIPHRLEEITLDNYENITKAIKSKVFIRNFDSCIKNWGPCEFFNRCHNDSDEGLIKVDEKHKN